jgi:ubiquinone/menaquinone biosynthesis C-methylase UbiE
MRLNRKEFNAMNNPLRRWIQKNIELKIFDSFLRRHGINLQNSIILDAGCGSGYSTQFIAAAYRPRELVAFDFMPEQIQRAKRRCQDALFFVGDVTDTHLASGKFDAVFVFGILHHVPGWKRALAELYRVLRPKGVLLVEEVNRTGSNLADRCFGFEHPPEGFFDWNEFSHALKETGFEIIEERKIYFSIFRSYLCVKN